MLGSLGGPEIILIFVVALLVFGPRRLPEIGRKVGGVVRDLRRATGEFRSNVEREIGMDPLDGYEKVQQARREILSTVSEPIREAAKGAMDSAREAGEEARAGSRGNTGKGLKTVDADSRTPEEGAQE